MKNTDKIKMKCWMSNEKKHIYQMKINVIMFKKVFKWFKHALDWIGHFFGTSRDHCYLFYI